MSVPKPTYTDEGFVPPAESDILAGALADLGAAFGGGLNPALDTPQGQLATTMTACLAAVNDLFLLFAAQSDPTFASGRMQDAIGRIYFIERNPAQPSVVMAQCVGALGVSINAYQQSFRDGAGGTWTCTQSGTFDATGVLVLPFAYAVPGPVVLPAGSSAQILNGTPGWDAVSVVTDAVPGSLVESRAAFETRRSQSVAVNALGWLPALRGAVLTVPGVIDAFVAENPQNGAQVIGGVSLAGNSIYVSVAGGAAADVARAIWSRKAPGCAYNGNTTVQVQDVQAGLVPPYPSYPVTFQTAVPLPILVSVTLASSPLVPSNATALVQTAVIAAFAGLDGRPRARIGAAFLASRLYAPVSALGPWAQVVDILVGSPVTLPSSTFSGSIAGNVLTVTAVQSGALAVGQYLDDATGAVLDGTYVTALGSGTGGTGSYAVSLGQSVAGEQMYGGTASSFRVPVTIGQIPVVSAADIIVSVA